MKCPIPLRWTQAGSDQHHALWGANCGPHSIAAAAGVSLWQVQRHIVNFRGWMNPSMVGTALTSLGIYYALRKGLRTRTLCNGISRIQWEGTWLNPGVPPAAAYAHTHFVAHFNGWVLCTFATPSEWIALEAWQGFLDLLSKPWHVTHHYLLPEPSHFMTTLERTIITVCRCLNRPETGVAPESTFFSLGADGLDCLEICLALEDEFEVRIPEEKRVLATTIGEMVAIADDLVAAGQAEPYVPNAKPKPMRTARDLLAMAMGEDEEMKEGKRTGIEQARHDLELGPMEETPFRKSIRDDPIRS